MLYCVQVQGLIEHVDCSIQSPTLSAICAVSFCGIVAPNGAIHLWGFDVIVSGAFMHDSLVFTSKLSLSFAAMPRAQVFRKTYHNVAREYVQKVVAF